MAAEPFETPLLGAKAKVAAALAGAGFDGRGHIGRAGGWRCQIRTDRARFPPI